MKAIIRQIRPKHWAKNFLVFLPGLFSHELSQEYFIATLPAFLSWCMFSSVVYVFNDLQDRETDALHPVKCRRPIASGEISDRKIKDLLIVLSALGIGTALTADFFFQMHLLMYLALNFTYTLKVKFMRWFDLTFLTFFYLLRILSGFAFIYSAVSPWFIGSCIALFLGLSSAKRLSDINGSLVGRSYRESDKLKLDWIIKVSWFLLAVILSIYPFSGAADAHYRHPWPIAFAGLTLIPLYKIVKNERQDLIDDLLKMPTVYALLAVLVGIFYFAI